MLFRNQGSENQNSMSLPADTEKEDDGAVPSKPWGEGISHLAPHTWPHYQVQTACAILRVE